MKKIDFKKIFKKKKKFSLKRKDYIKPHHGWRNLVWVTIFSGLVLIVFSLYLFTQIKNDNLFKVDDVEEVQPETIKEELLTKILKSFEEKEENTNKILSNEVVFKDPSF